MSGPYRDTRPIGMETTNYRCRDCGKVERHICDQTTVNVKCSQCGGISDPVSPRGPKR